MSGVDSPDEHASRAFNVVSSALGGLLLAVAGSLIWHCADDSFQFGMELPYGYTASQLSPVSPFGRAVICTQPLLPFASSQAAPFVLGAAAAVVIYLVLSLWGWLTNRK
jgi:hypothetical protein